jgi:hypothetical protein
VGGVRRATYIKAGVNIERALHVALRDALQAGIRNTDFLLWIAVDPTGKGESFARVDELVDEVEKYLAGLDPDQVGSETVPLELHDEVADVQVIPWAKKESSRGERALQLVAPEVPVTVEPVR